MHLLRGAKVLTIAQANIINSEKSTAILPVAKCTISSSCDILYINGMCERIRRIVLFVDSTKIIGMKEDIC